MFNSRFVSWATTMQPAFELRKVLRCIPKPRNWHRCSRLSHPSNKLSHHAAPFLSSSVIESPTEDMVAQALQTHRYVWGKFCTASTGHSTAASLLGLPALDSTALSRTPCCSSSNMPARLAMICFDCSGTLEDLRCIDAVLLSSVADRRATVLLSPEQHVLLFANLQRVGLPIAVLEIFEGRATASHTAGTSDFWRREATQDALSNACIQYMLWGLSQRAQQYWFCGVNVLFECRRICRSTPK